MRQIKIAEIVSDDWEEWKAKCISTTADNIELFDAGGEVKIGDLYKEKYVKDNYYFTEDEPFFGKCVYCETPIYDIFPGDVEHYRPKGKVTDHLNNIAHIKNEDGTEIKDSNGQSIPHPGYFWLAYEWTNLMPSCTFCNRPKKDFGKRSCFPVENFNRHIVGEEAKENPLIINPVSDKSEDNPENHLSVDFDTGLLISKTKKGEMMINIFGLNKRNYIRKGRLTAIRNAKWTLAELFFNPGSKDDSLREINEYMEGRRSYSFAFVSYCKHYLKNKNVIDLS